MEIAQMYVHCKSDALFRPYKEMKGFKKVFINPGEVKRVKIPFDDKTFRYFNVVTNRWEIEEADYEIMIGASSVDIRLCGIMHIKGTGAQLPYKKEKLPSYYRGDAGNVGREEFEILLGREIPSSRWDRKKDLACNDTISQCRYARGLIARIAYWIIVFAHWALQKAGKRNTANLIMMSVYNMPFRGIARMTGGSVSMAMVDGILLMVNGHFFKGLFKFLKEWRSHSKK
jgi:beta-glucosidase